MFKYRRLKLWMVNIFLLLMCVVTLVPIVYAFWQQNGNII